MAQMMNYYPGYNPQAPVAMSKNEAIRRQAANLMNDAANLETLSLQPNGEAIEVVAPNNIPQSFYSRFAKTTSIVVAITAATVYIQAYIISKYITLISSEYWSANGGSIGYDIAAFLLFGGLVETTRRVFVSMLRQNMYFVDIYKTDNDKRGRDLEIFGAVTDALKINYSSAAPKLFSTWVSSITKIVIMASKVPVSLVVLLFIYTISQRVVTWIGGGAQFYNPFDNLVSQTNYLNSFLQTVGSYFTPSGLTASMIPPSNTGGYAYPGINKVYY